MRHEAKMTTDVCTLKRNSRDSAEQRTHTVLATSCRLWSQSLAIGMATVILSACEPPPENDHSRVSSKTSQQQESRANLSLQMPQSLPKSCTQIRVTLSKSDPASRHREPQIFIFDVNHKEMLIADLEPGTYEIEVELLDGEYGTLLEHGSGHATVIACQKVIAEIKMNPAENGGLVIAMVHDSDAPQECVSRREDYQEFPVRFEVKIVSGSKRGQKFYGGLSYRMENEMSDQEQVAELTDFRFCFAGKLVTLANFDPIYYSLPVVQLRAGKFEKMLAIGGDGTGRFGFNGGFERYQFGRIEEEYIRRGEYYFGYLDARTNVDGAGKVTYTTAL